MKARDFSSVVAAVCDRRGIVSDERITAVTDRRYNRQLVALLCLFFLGAVPGAFAYVAKTNAQIDTLVGTCPGTYGLTSGRCTEIGKTIKSTRPQQWNEVYNLFQLNATTAEKNFAATLFTTGEWNDLPPSASFSLAEQILAFTTTTAPASTYVIPAIDPATKIPYRVPFSSFAGAVGLPNQTGHAGEALVTNGSTADWAPATGAGLGDASTNTSISVPNEVVLFADTSGKIFKRATGTGLLYMTAGEGRVALASDINDLINSTVAPVFANITNKPTTLAGYGVTEVPVSMITGATILNQTDPNFDAIESWDNVANDFKFISLGTGFSLSGTSPSRTLQYTIPNNTVTYAMMQDVTATARFLGRKSSGAGDPEQISAAEAKTILGYTITELTGPLNSATMVAPASDARVTRPMIVYARVTVQTSGTVPADVGTITIPTGITRWRLNGTTAANGGCIMINESLASTSVAASFAVWTGAGGTGTNLTTAATGPTSVANNVVSIAPATGSAQTANTLYVQQTGANSGGAGDISIQLTLYPIPIP